MKLVTYAGPSDCLSVRPSPPHVEQWEYLYELLQETGDYAYPCESIPETAHYIYVIGHDPSDHQADLSMAKATLAWRVGKLSSRKQ